MSTDSQSSTVAESTDPPEDSPPSYSEATNYPGNSSPPHDPPQWGASSQHALHIQDNSPQHASNIQDAPSQHAPHIQDTHSQHATTHNPSPGWSIPSIHIQELPPIEDTLTGQTTV